MRRDDLERRMKFIFDKYEAGIYTDEMFLQRKAEIDKEKEGLNDIQVEVPTEVTPAEIDPNFIKENINSIIETYRNTKHKSDRNKILRSISIM